MLPSGKAAFYQRYLVLIFFFFTGWAKAQSLILGIPNAETVEPGVLEITHESQIGFDSPGTWNSFNIFTYGVGAHTELTANLINLDKTFVPGTTFAFGAKHIVPLSSSAREWKLTLGTNAGYAPKIDYERWGVFSYSHLSMRLPILNTRLTGGASYGTPHFFGFQTPKTLTDSMLERRKGLYMVSAMAGVEQPLSTRWALIADWFSGNHAQGAFIGGVQYSPPGMALIVAYKHPNGDASKRALVLEAVVDIVLKRHTSLHTQHGSR